MLKKMLIGFVMLLIAGTTLAQDNLNVSEEIKFQIQGTIVGVVMPEQEYGWMGTLLTPDYILTELYEWQPYSSDYLCESRDHLVLRLWQVMYGATGEACVLVMDDTHNFALLQVESWEMRLSTERIPPPPIEIDTYSPIRTPVYAAFYANATTMDFVQFEAGTITAMPIEPQEADGETLQQRHYLTDFQGLEYDNPNGSDTYNILGNPVVDENGTVIGIMNGISPDPKGQRQFVRVLPLTTICRVNAEVCALIQPPLAFPPQDRTQVPAGVELLQTGEIDLKTRITNLCKTFSMKGDLADTESGWACFRSSGTIGLQLGALEIDAICQEAFNQMEAFALLSGSDKETAYQWRCYRPKNG